MYGSITRYVDESVCRDALPTKDIYRDMVGETDANTYNLQGLIDYGTGEILPYTENVGLPTMRCGLTSAMRVYRERCRRVRKGQTVYRETNGDIWSDLRKVAYIWDEYKHTL